MYRFAFKIFLDFKIFSKSAILEQMLVHQYMQLFNTFCSKLVHDNDPVDFDLNSQCIYNIFNRDMMYPCNKTLIDEQNMQRLQRS